MHWRAERARFRFTSRQVKSRSYRYDAHDAHAFASQLDPAARAFGRTVKPPVSTSGTTASSRADRAALETPHLRLTPWTPAQLLAMIESAARFESEAGLPLADGLREFFVSGEVSPAWVELLRSAPGPDAWTLGFGVQHRDESRVIGSAGFKGPPGEDGIVEIAYGIAPGYQGRGFATEAARALVAFALERVDVTAIRAHTMPENGASSHVLAKCGFERVGEVVDPEDGLVWRWERHVG